MAFTAGLSMPIWARMSVGAGSGARDGEDRLPDLRLGDPPELGEIDVGQIGQLVCRHDGVDDCRTLAGQGLGQDRPQLAGLVDLEAATPAGLGERREVGLGNLMPSSKAGRPIDSASR